MGGATTLRLIAKVRTGVHRHRLLFGAPAPWRAGFLWLNSREHTPRVHRSAGAMAAIPLAARAPMACWSGDPAPADLGAEQRADRCEFAIDFESNAEAVADADGPARSSCRLMVLCWPLALCAEAGATGFVHRWLKESPAQSLSLSLVRAWWVRLYAHLWRCCASYGWRPI